MTLMKKPEIAIHHFPAIAHFTHLCSLFTARGMALGAGKTGSLTVSINRVSIVMPWTCADMVKARQ